MMHAQSLDHMKINLSTHLDLSKVHTVLDVGSMEVKKKGSYRDVIPTFFPYTGLDQSPGPNVDVITEDPYSFPFPDASFDVVLSGQCFEHTENPFKLIEECSRVIKPNGFFFGVAPSKWSIHRYPVDCWRLLPDGWVALFKHSNLAPINCYINCHINSSNEDCWGIACKK